MSKFDVVDSDGKITNEARMGTGTLFHQITERCFIIATCAHNFIIFKQNRKLNEDNKSVMVN